MNDAHKRILKENYEKACNGYIEALLSLWDYDGEYGFWVGDEVGGLYSCNDWLFVNMQDVIYCVENNISSEDYGGWQDYCVKCEQYKLPTMNLKSWHKGAPRVPQETFDRLDSLMSEIDKISDRYKEKTTTYDY
jgi:hypothetical protein